MSNQSEEIRQLRECLRDFVAMARLFMEPAEEQAAINDWERLCHDAENILNREDNSYDKAAKP